MLMQDEYTGLEVAIVGMSCRFPGAASPDKFWQNINAGHESVRQLSDLDLAIAGISPDVSNTGNYIRAAARLKDTDKFDAGFFGITAREAKAMDPQHRLFLECTWEALEDAGYAKRCGAITTALVAGSGPNTYFAQNVVTDHDFTQDGMLDSMSGFQAMLGNDKDYLPTRAAYKLGLKGPAINVQTACSTSLVALHMACRMLQVGECDLALAGGATVLVPDGAGYIYQDAMILSSDGHCRPFDAKASGTVFGSGVGTLALRRLSDALESSDRIHAIIKGSAINNDGSDKASFSAPSVAGQADVIRKALDVAEVAPESISYVEAHGTGTLLGDPIEMEALQHAFSERALDAGPVAVGSVKANVGHLIAAAGVASVIKTVLAMKERTLPPAINFDAANTEIDFESSPFYVNTQSQDWTSNGPLRAGVSSFGVGGTNAHMILEEAPERVSSDSQHDQNKPFIMTLSAQNPRALDEIARSATEAVLRAENHEMESLCFTANVGRRAFEYRLSASGRTGPELAKALNAARTQTVQCDTGQSPRLAGLFTGQGAQSAGMGRSLYDHEPVFKAIIDQCDEVLRPLLEHSLSDVLYHDPSLSNLIHETAYTQPALFAVEVGLYELWRSRGIQPQIVMGHSVGEYAAAYAAGIFSLEDGLKLIAKRGALMQALPQGGAMLAVTAKAADVSADLCGYEAKVSVAAQNSNLGTVISGDGDAIDALEKLYQERGTTTLRLKVSHAFHSPLMDPIVAEFREFTKGIAFQTPSMTLVSNLTGDVADESITTPDYWADHIRQPVLFHQSLGRAAEIGSTAYLEFGPHAVLTGLGQAVLGDDVAPSCWIASLHRDDDDRDAIARATGQLFCAGIEPDWQAILPSERGQITDFPTYAFQRERHWIDSPNAEAPSWHCRAEWEVMEPADGASPKGAWVVIGDKDGIAAQIAEQWKEADARAELVVFGSDIAQVSDGHWQADMYCSDSVSALLDDIVEQDVTEIAGLIFVAPHIANDAAPKTQGAVAQTMSGWVNKLAATLQASGSHAACADARLWLITQQVEQVADDEIDTPSATTILGAALQGVGKVIANEHPDIWGGGIDLSSEPQSIEIAQLATLIAANKSSDMPRLCRGADVYLPNIVATNPAYPTAAIDPDKTYLVTGGLGALGKAATQLLIRLGAKHIVLTSRTTTTPEKHTAIEDLRTRCPDLRVCAVDVSDHKAMTQVINDIAKSGHPLAGILHTAGIVEDGMLSLMTDPETIARVLAPKVDGTLILDQLTRDASLDFFVCFSSISALLGMKGQAAYVAANAAMNQIVAQRNADGLPGVSIEWGPWADIGMAAGLTEPQRQRLADFGLFGIDTEAGLERLEALLLGTGTLTAAPVFWKRYAEKQYGTVPRHLSQIVTRQAVQPAIQKTSEVETLADMLEPLKSDEREDRIAEFLRGRIAQLLGIDDPASVPTQEPLNRMGFDSLMTIEFRNSVTKLGIKLSLEKLVMGATVADLITDLLAQTSVQLDTAGEPASPQIIKGSEDEYDKNCVIIPRPNPDATIRLIGIPYAGGGPLVFQSWVNKLPDFVELGILQLPGRSARLKEPFYTRMEDMLEQLVPDILPFVQKPFAFFGHCVGGVQSFEVAQRLRKDHGIQPEHLFVAGGRSPQIYNEAQFAIDVQQFNHETGKAEHELNEVDFVDMLREVNFANNKALFEDSEMRGLMLPIIQADYEINNYYRYKKLPPLDAPITAIGGRIDPYVTGEHIIGWNKHTTKDFKAHFCTGDHYFMEHQGDLLTRIAADDLARFAPDAPERSQNDLALSGAV